MANTISISVLADVARARKGIESVDNQLSGFGKSASKIGKVMKGAFAVAGAAAVAAPVVGFLKDSVSAASDLNETISKTKTVFGPASADILKFGKNAAVALGMSKQEALDGASTFGNFFDQIGIGRKVSAEMSKTWVKMSADLGSFHNAAPTEVMDALASATRGEYDSLQKFIPTINAAAVEQKALADTGKASAKELTNAEKAAAVYSLTLKGQGKAAGDFKRTSGSLANQQKILGAQWTNLKTTIGTALLPVITKFVTFLNSNLMPAFGAMKEFLGPIVASLKEFFNGFGQGSGQMSAVTTFIKGSVVPAFMGIWNALKQLGAVVLPIMNQIKGAVMNTFNGMAPQMSGIWNNIKTIITGALQIIKAVIQNVTKVIQAVWKTFGGTILSFITNTFRNIAQVVGGVMKALAGVIKTILAVLKGDWKGAWNGIKQIVAGVWQAIGGIVKQAMNILKTVISVAWTVVKTVTSAAWNAIKNAVTNGVQNVLAKVRALPGQIKGFFAGAASWLYNAGMDIVRGLINGLNAAKGWISAKISELANMIPDKLKGILGIASPSKVTKKLGKFVVQGLVKGMQSGETGLDKRIKSMTGTIKKRFGGAAAKTFGAWMKANGKTMKKFSRQIASANQRLQEQRDVVSDLIKQKDDYAASIAQGYMSYGSVVNLNSAFTPEAMQQQMQARVKKVQDYLGLLKTLLTKGVNKDMVSQLAQAGVEGGYAYAQALASAGPEIINTFNSLQSQLASAANAIGDTVAAPMHDAGIQAAQGVAQGLQQKTKVVIKGAKKFAQKLVKAVKKSLKIKSPSRVFMELGRQTIKGMEVGLADTRGVEKATVRIADAMKSSFNPQLETLAPAASTSGGTGGEVINLNVNVPPTSNPAEVGRAIANALDSYYRQGGRRLAV